MIKITKEGENFVMSMSPDEMSMLMRIMSALPENLESIAWEFSGDPDLEPKDVDNFVKRFYDAERLCP